MADHEAQAPAPGWASAVLHGLACRYAGSVDAASEFARAVALHGVGDPGPLGAVAAGLNGHFACVCEHADGVAAVVDCVRSYPLFHCLRGGVRFTPAPRDMVPEAPEVDRASVLELLMSGYVTGGRTVYEGVRQLGPGEVAVEPHGGPLSVARYYVFHPMRLNESGPDALADELGRRTDAIFARLVREAAGRPVLVPLSGGLDSRLVLAKLVEHGCPRVRAFSYGPPGNGEAAVAGRVAERLGVPWFYLRTTRARARQAFAHPSRRRYWAMADGLSTVPNMQEFLAFHMLEASGELADAPVVVNGQSGDFITGGHMPQSLAGTGAGPDDLVSHILRKHYALWTQLLDPDALDMARGRISRVAEDLCAGQEGFDSPLCYAFDAWEWAERQSRYVVNQQRIYDFHSLAWRLPLWDREYLDFWRDVPAAHMFGQGLYKDWLRRWNYKGLFCDPSLDKPIWRWPGMWRLVVPAARAVGLVGGRRAKDGLYALMRYFGHYSFQYGSYPYGYYASRALAHRNPVSLFAETWVRENLPDHVPDGL